MAFWGQVGVEATVERCPFAVSTLYSMLSPPAIDRLLMLITYELQFPHVFPFVPYFSVSCRKTVTLLLFGLTEGGCLDEQ